jgi:hypothetical protein
MNGTAPALVRVWDPLVRIDRWALVAGFAVAYATEDDLDLHVPIRIRRRSHHSRARGVGLCGAPIRAVFWLSLPSGGGRRLSA